MHRFQYAGHAQDIYFGSSAVDTIGETLEPFSWKRILLCTSGSKRRSGQAERVERAIGARLAATFDRVQPHVQEEQVDEVLAIAQEHDVDAIVALGGGSVLGMGKAVSDALQEKRTGTLARESSPLVPALVPVVAIPTTYAGSEMTTVYGVTRPVEGGRRKITVSGRNIVPRVVIYDPELTLDLPWEITGTSAMNALAHCFEALYSSERDPLSSAAALQGIRAIGLSLPSVHADGHDLDARSQLLEGAFLAGSALAQVTMGIHHGVCHVLGGSAGVPHGVANTIVLPHALRFNREVARQELAESAIVLDLAGRTNDPLEAADSVIEWLQRLIDDLGLPKRLRDHGVEAYDLPRLAEIAMLGGPVKSNPRTVRDRAEMEAFLQGMW